MSLLNNIFSSQPYTYIEVIISDIFIDTNICSANSLMMIKHNRDWNYRQIIKPCTVMLAVLVAFDKKRKYSFIYLNIVLYQFWYCANLTVHKEQKD